MVRGEGGNEQAATYVPGPYRAVARNTPTSKALRTTSSNRRESYGSVDTGPNARLGETETLVYEINNLGSAPLAIGTITFANLNNVNTLRILVPSVSTILGGNSTTVVFEFAVLHAGAYSFDIVVSNNDADEGSYTIRVVGSSTPIISVEGPEYFNVLVGRPISAFWTVKNVGSGVLVISAFDTDDPEFSVFGLPVPLSLSAGETHTFRISFFPVERGSVLSGLQLTSNSNGSAGHVSGYRLTGEGSVLGFPKLKSGSDCSVSTARAQPPFALALLCLAGLACLLRRRRLAE